MRRTIVYYPNIEIPDGSWLRKSLLYWDEVSSIVPRSIEHELYNSYLIAQLKDENQYRAIYPDQLMYSEVFSDFEHEIINKLKRYTEQENRKIYKSGSILKTTGHRMPIHNEKIFTNFDIHSEKIPYRLMEKLEQVGCVSPKGDWMNFDSRLANIYMATLAKYSALADVNYTVIGTDKPSLINSVYPINYPRNKPLNYKTPVVNMSLNILPSPSIDVPIERIIRFKRKYKAELLSLRTQINQFEQEISNSESYEDMKEKVVLYKEKIEKETRETIRMLKGDRINFLFSSLKSVISLKSPTLITTIAGEFIGLPQIATLTGAGIAGTVDVSLNYLALTRATRDRLSDKGFLYLYYANRKRLINDFT